MQLPTAPYRMRRGMPALGASRWPHPFRLLSVAITIQVLPVAALASIDAATEDDAAYGRVNVAAYQLNQAPRVTRVDLAVPTGTIDVAGTQNLQPDSTRLTDVSHRWWWSNGRADFGVGFGALALTAVPLSAAPDASPILLASAPSLTLGMRYRTTRASTMFADAAGARSLGLNSGDAYLGKVGVEWKAASLASRWNVTYGGLGWRLSQDSKMTLRVRSGGVGLYMRSQF